MSGPIDYESRLTPSAAFDATAPVVCPKCESSMEMGTIGTSERSGPQSLFFFAGKFEPALLGHKFTCVGEYPLIPCRCVRCGLVEWYAPKSK